MLLQLTLRMQICWIDSLHIGPGPWLTFEFWGGGEVVSTGEKMSTVRNEKWLTIAIIMSQRLILE